MFEQAVRNITARGHNIGGRGLTELPRQTFLAKYAIITGNTYPRRRYESNEYRVN